MTVIAHLAGLFIRATAGRRVLEIGTGDSGAAMAIAEALPHDGVLITLERDRAAGERARTLLAQNGYADIVSVMVGDASRYLHKVAGPFDVIVQNADTSQYATLHDRIVRLLAPGGTLITNDVARGGGYNEMLAADRRLSTMLLNVGDGVAVSVRITNSRGGDSDR